MSRGSADGHAVNFCNFSFSPHAFFSSSLLPTFCLAFFSTPTPPPRSPLLPSPQASPSRSYFSSSSPFPSFTGVRISVVHLVCQRTVEAPDRKRECQFGYEQDAEEMFGFFFLLQNIIHDKIHGM